MNKLSRILVILGASVLLYIAGVFGTSILNNLHLKYLRGLGQNTVLIKNSTGSGATGFIVKGTKSGDFFVMTNGHVCGLAEDNKVLVTYRSDTYVLEVIKKYQYNDLCAIAVPESVTKAFKIAKNYDLGSAAFVIGYPQLEPLSIATGELSGEILISIQVSENRPKEECTGPTYTYYTDDIPELYKTVGLESVCIRSMLSNTSTIVISPGNSGSPVVNIWGEVVAVTFASNESGTRSYHVPLADLVQFLSEL